MSKTVVIHQPDFLPYLGFFHRLLFADLFVVLDCVQFVHSNRSWTHRDKIKTPQGAKWLTVSVRKTGRDTAIRDVLLSSEVDWRRDNLNQLRQNYRSAPYFEEVYHRVEHLYAYSGESLAEFNLRSIDMLMQMLGIQVPMVLSSSLQAEGKKNELLVDILKKVGADRYLSGIGAKEYYRPEPFAEANIEVIWQSFSHPVYPQQFGEFVPCLSSIDLLFNCGIERSKEILRGVG